MEDTSNEIKIMQRMLHKQLPEDQKWARGFEMIENGRATMIASLKQKFPADSDTDVFIKMVKALYKNDLSAEFLEGFELKVRAMKKE